MPPPTIVRFLSRTGADTPKPRTVRPDKARDEFAWNAPFPVAFVVDTTHGVGATLKVPTSPWNRSEGPVPAFRTLCSPIACRPGLSGAVTHSSGPPVTVLKRHRPASMFVFRLAPWTDKVYGRQTVVSKPDKGSR